MAEEIRGLLGESVGEFVPLALRFTVHAFRTFAVGRVGKGGRIIGARSGWYLGAYVKLTMRQLHSPAGRRYGGWKQAVRIEARHALQGLEGWPWDARRCRLTSQVFWAPGAGRCPDPANVHKALEDSLNTRKDWRGVWDDDALLAGRFGCPIVAPGQAPRVEVLVEVGAAGGWAFPSL